MYPAAALMEVVEGHQIRLEAVMDAIDMKTLGLMAAIGKVELDNFRERSTMGKRGAAKQGRGTGTSSWNDPPSLCDHPRNLAFRLDQCFRVRTSACRCNITGGTTIGGRSQHLLGISRDGHKE